MVRTFFVQSLPAVGLVNTAYAIKTVAEANSRCQKYMPGTIAVIKPDGSDWG